VILALSRKDLSGDRSRSISATIQDADDFAALSRAFEVLEQ
jgi:hypothetical protein